MAVWWLVILAAFGLLQIDDLEAKPKKTKANAKGAISKDEPDQAGISRIDDQRESIVNIERAEPGEFSGRIEQPTALTFDVQPGKDENTTLLGKTVLMNMREEDIKLYVEAMTESLRRDKLGRLFEPIPAQLISTRNYEITMSHFHIQNGNSSNVGITESADVRLSVELDVWLCAKIIAVHKKTGERMEDDGCLQRLPWHHMLVSVSFQTAKQSPAIDDAIVATRVTKGTQLEIKTNHHQVMYDLADLNSMTTVMAKLLRSAFDQSLVEATNKMNQLLAGKKGKTNVRVSVKHLVMRWDPPGIDEVLARLAELSEE